jgi:hypothetical protein
MEDAVVKVEGRRNTADDIEEVTRLALSARSEEFQISISMVLLPVSWRNHPYY